MSTALLSTVLVTSFVGSLHCAGMCGPFVAFYAAQPDSKASRPNQFAGHLFYNLGRLISYTTLGLIAGSVGAAVDIAGHAAQVNSIAAIAAGTLILLWGGVSLLRALGYRKTRRKGLDVFPAQSLTRVRNRRSEIRAGVLGLVSGLLPCGWLWAFVIVAAGTASALDGAIVMGVFWLGTVPLLVGLGLLTRRVGLFIGSKLPIVTAIALLALGGITIAGRIPLIETVYPDSDRQSAPNTTIEPTCHGHTSD